MLSRPPSPAEDRQLADQRHALQFQVVREHHVAADVGQHRQRAGRDDRAADRQAVEAVRQVHGVAEVSVITSITKIHERQKRQPVHMRNAAHPLPHQVRPEALQTAPSAASSSFPRPPSRPAATATAPLAETAAQLLPRGQPLVRLCTTLM
jgi:hypothetical protein